MSTGRRWTLEEKRAIVAEYEDAPSGSKAAVLRRHRVAMVNVQRWASYRDVGVLETGLRGEWRTRMTPKAESAELGRLRAQVSRLQAEVDQAHQDRQVAEAVAHSLGKASALLQAMLQSADPTPAPSSPPASRS